VLKVERVYRTVYPTREMARKDIARYIEIRYNRKRLHSALGYRTPEEVHDEYLNRQPAA
jgi:putative transposase